MILLKDIHLGLMFVFYNNNNIYLFSLFHQKNKCLVYVCTVHTGNKKLHYDFFINIKYYQYQFYTYSISNRI